MRAVVDHLLASPGSNKYQLDPAVVKMDIPELDQDVIVQQSSAGLISDFDRSLGPFLRKPNGHLRSRVRVQEVARLTLQVRSSSMLSRPSLEWLASRRLADVLI